MKGKNARMELAWAFIAILIVISIGAIIYYAFTIIGSSAVTGEVIETDLEGANNTGSNIGRILPPIPSTGKKHSIRIQDSGFSPPALRIEPGDTVFWTNHGEMTHTVTSDSGHELNSGDIDAGTGYYHTFNANGTYDYHCEKHKEMKGKIFVQV